MCVANYVRRFANQRFKNPLVGKCRASTTENTIIYILKARAAEHSILQWASQAKVIQQTFVLLPIAPITCKFGCTSS
jgi:hypothetical protein